VLREIVIGSPAFWCPETPNFVVGVCAELVIVAGHTHTFVWSMQGGAPLGVWSRRDLHRATSIMKKGDEVLVDLPDRRLTLVTATGATVAEEPLERGWSLRIDNARTAMTLRSPAGVESVRAVAWTRDGCIAREGARYALDHSTGPVKVYDAATHEVVHTAVRGGTPTLSADGRYLVVSMLGPPRTWIEDVDRGVAMTPALPPAVYTVTLGHPSVCVVDDGVWTLPGAGEGAPARVATIEAWGATRAIRGESIVGVGGGAVGRWRLADGAREALVAIPARKAYSLSADAAGRTVALTLDDSHGLLALFPDGVWLADLDAGTLVRITDDTGPATVCIAPAGDVVAIVDETGDSVRLVDRAGEPLLTPELPAPVRWAQFSPDGAHVLVVGYAVTEEQRLAGEDGVETAYLVDRAGAVATVGPGTWRGWLGEHLVRRAGDTLERVDPATGAVMATTAVEAAPTRVWFDERRIALASNDGCLRLRDLVWRRVPP
jgi:hypothetical protein